jgi:hypothetical protein
MMTMNLETRSWCRLNAGWRRRAMPRSLFDLDAITASASTSVCTMSPGCAEENQRNLSKPGEPISESASMPSHPDF